MASDDQHTVNHDHEAGDRASCGCRSPLPTHKNPKNKAKKNGGGETKRERPKFPKAHAPSPGTAVSSSAGPEIDKREKAVVGRNESKKDKETKHRCTIARTVVVTLEQNWLQTGKRQVERSQENQKVIVSITGPRETNDYLRNL